VHVAMHAYGNDETQTETVRTAFAEYMERHAKEVDAAAYLKALPLTEESETHLRAKDWEPVHLGLDRWTRARAIALAAAKRLTLNEFVNQAVLESLPLSM